MFLLVRNKYCPECRAPHQELLQDTRVAGGSVAGAFLASFAPELVVWLAVGAGLLARGLLGVSVGIAVFCLLLLGAWWLERRLTIYLCLVCGRKSRYAELLRVK